MRVTGWAELELPMDVLLTMAGEARARVEEALETTAPSGFAHNGVGGEALASELASQLRCPELVEADTVTFVPFATEGVREHREGERLHLVIGTETLREAWPASRDAAYASSVSEAVRAVQRGAPTALEHELWLEHFLVVQLVPIAERLNLPVAIRWRPRAVRTEGLDRALDSALSSWDG